MVGLEQALWPELIAAAVFLIASIAEWIHSRRIAHIAGLAFGPSGKPAIWARSQGFVRSLAIAAITWGFVSLLFVEPKNFGADGGELRLRGDPQHVLLVLDVSPSMRLVDAGPSQEQSRMQRARDLMESFFDRVPIEYYRVSVVAFYNGAKPVVVDTKDFEVVRNILGDLPMHYAFVSGKTRLLDGLAEAAKIAKPWNPNSTTLVVISDGDTVPATGMPRMPASIKSVLVVGVGDPRVGKFIDGRQSRQDVATLRQVAARLRGTFHNGNEKHLASSLVAESTGIEDESVFQKLTRREYALIACTAGSLFLALLPLLLHFFGTGWRPGTSPPSRLRDGRGTLEARVARLGWQIPFLRGGRGLGPKHATGRTSREGQGDRMSTRKLG